MMRADEPELLDGASARSRSRPAGARRDGARPALLAPARPRVHRPRHRRASSSSTPTDARRSSAGTTALRAAPASPPPAPPDRPARRTTDARPAPSTNQRCPTSMSTSIDQAFVKQFEREVHEAYQRQGSKLRGDRPREERRRRQLDRLPARRHGRCHDQGAARHGAGHERRVQRRRGPAPSTSMSASGSTGSTSSRPTSTSVRCWPMPAPIALGRKTDELIIEALSGATLTAGTAAHAAHQGQGAAGVRDPGHERRARRRPALRRHRLAAVVGSARPAGVRQRRVRRRRPAPLARHPGQVLARHRSGCRIPACRS